ncbi:saccharopine dehydrogenase NADP-binding domain-containing protein [Couchioplanes caeruleus]|uniref:Saccharopine dehydrogenase n=2 Tax=Couchioplanes caeruleus TaxID=56438 RepID=A0A1K0GEJ5_9ACTN|nr:saccharopine dehydrogenase NADP-binding domain-containing protein [Couchioplanes caeruleus]OJF10566.1 saccharopine dehydrogenase [Couchioplanes caeruleus subsp. caeruleus]ROP28663.1 saccharopine dehydrogenase-like protein [Couchioplanes caeruleus]
MRVLVLGGYGAVGARVVAELRRRGDEPIVAGRDPQRAERVVDLADPAALRAAAAGAEVVVNAAGHEDPAIAQEVTDAGAAFVDVTATTAYVAALQRLRPRRPILASVGLAPGLTNLLAAAAHAAAPGPVEIAVLLGAGERHGAAATAWSYRLLGRRFADASGGPVRNYSRPRRFDLPGHGRRRLYRTDFSDQHVLTRDLGAPVRTYFGLDSTLATTALAGLTWLPGAAHAPRGLHFPGGDGWVALARTAAGGLRWATGRGQSQATAVIAAAAAHIAAGLPPGVHHLHQVTTLADLPAHQHILLGGSCGTTSSSSA